MRNRVVFTLYYYRFERLKFEFSAFVLFLESICNGRKTFGHSLGPSVDKKNEFPQMIVILCNAGYVSNTPQVWPTPPISDKMLTVLLLKPSPTNPVMGPAGKPG
jgi:hypothetical protein